MYNNKLVRIYTFNDIIDCIILEEDSNCYYFLCNRGKQFIFKDHVFTIIILSDYREV